jgi:hypothetical protein
MELINIIAKMVDKAYIEEEEDKYLGYARETPKTLLKHPQTELCKVKTKEKVTAVEAFDNHGIKQLTWSHGSRVWPNSNLHANELESPSLTSNWHSK